MTVNTFCRACGNKQEPDALFCNACGATVAAPSAPAEGRAVAASPLFPKGAPVQANLHAPIQSSSQERGIKSCTGLRVSMVRNGSQAERLGINVGDHFVSYNGIPVASNLELSNAVHAAKTKKLPCVVIVLLRQDQELKLEASLESLGIDCEEPSEKIFASAKPSTEDYETEYSISRVVSAIVASIGWIVVLAGIVIVLGALSNDSKTMLGALSMVAILPGIGAVISGFILILWAQVLRAVIDNADHTRKIMKLLYRKMN